MHSGVKYLFVINPVSGQGENTWENEIHRFFGNRKETVDFITLEKQLDVEDIKKIIKEKVPENVVAVGGDGTLKLLATILKNSSLPLGLLPAGSANGMAKELGIPTGAAAALETLVNSQPGKIDLVEFPGGETCIHLSDCGLNAAIVRHFDKYPTRGWLTYGKALWKALKAKNKFRCAVKTDTELLHRRAYMVVIANATKYGMGAVINPVGRLNDEKFEVIIIRKLNFFAILNAFVKGKPFHPEKVEVLQTRSVEISLRREQPFQIDGEYMGKMKKITATILPGALTMLLPEGYGTGF
ncbi:MAG: diacylglycerol/lipid kinase family protein [Flavisolibacter sp.]